jgi:hypothetical protein
LKKTEISSRSLAKTFVIYDKKTGDIIHTHQSLSLAPSETLDEKELELEALELASRVTNRSQSDMALMPIRAEDLSMEIEYRVNVDTKHLEAKGKVNQSQTRV